MKWQLLIEGESISDLQGIITHLPARKIEVITEPLKEKKPTFEVSHITNTDHVNFSDHPLEDAMKKNCLECGKEFVPKQTRTLYCSKSCYMKKFNREHREKDPIKKDPEPTASFDHPSQETRICQDPKCQKTFVPTHKLQLYCSKLCSSRGSVRLSALKKKETRTNENSIVIKKEHKHLKGESFYNGQSPMP
jgi:hypothetical protein